MRTVSLVLCLAVVAGAAACNSDNVTSASRPPLAGVRYINAVPDTGAVDIRMIDQIEYSAVGNALAYRSGTEHQPVEAKARHVRVFPNSFDQAIAQKYMVDTTITFEANTKYTLIVAGTAAAKNIRLVVLTDAPAAFDTTTSIALKVVNAGALAAVDGYAVDTTVTAFAGTTPVAANLAAFAASNYVTRARGRLAVRSAAAGGATALASAQAPAGVQGDTLSNPVAGANVAGTAISAYVFPRSTAGTGAPQTAAFTNPAVIFFMDRIPTTVPKRS